MRIKYDADTDAAYLYLSSPGHSGAAVRTVPVDPREIDGEIYLDFDAEGHLIGIESQDASRFLDPTVLRSQS
jgi:uncharacterized protein YuzE